MLDDNKIHLGENVNIQGLISKFDDLNVPAALHDVVGCFISPNPKGIAGPNSRRFPARPTEHANTTHVVARYSYCNSTPNKFIVIENPTHTEELVATSSSQCTLILKST